MDNPTAPSAQLAITRTLGRMEGARLVKEARLSLPSRPNSPIFSVNLLEALRDECRGPGVNEDTRIKLLLLAATNFDQSPTGPEAHRQNLLFNNYAVLSTQPGLLVRVRGDNPDPNPNPNPPACPSPHARSP